MLTTVYTYCVLYAKESITQYAGSHQSYQNWRIEEYMYVYYTVKTVDIWNLMAPKGAVENKTKN